MSSVKEVVANIFGDAIDKSERCMKRLNVTKLSQKELDNIKDINETISLVKQKLNIKE